MGLVEALADKFRSSLSPELLRSRAFWKAVSALAKSPLGRPGNEADAFSMLYAVENTREAYLGSGPVAWGSLLFPSELIHGTGVTAFYPETAAAVMSAAGAAERFLQRTAAEGFSPDLCSFHRVILGAALEGFLPEPSVLLSASALCDSAPLSFGYLADFYGVEHVSIDVPVDARSEADSEILTEQLRDAARSLADLHGSPRTAETERMMQDSIELSNEAGRYACKVEELRKGVPSPLNGWDALGHLAVLATMPGTDACVDFYRALAERLENDGTDPSGDGQEHRLLWMHLKPYFPTGLAALLAERKAVIVCEEYNRFFWDRMDPGRPYRSLAEKILSHPSVGPAERRASKMVQLARAYRVDGAVHFSHRGCRQSSGCAMLVRDELARAGVRTLVLDGECLDSREHNEGQARTRLEAFLESLASG